MKLSELILAVGDENITFQNLQANLAGVTNGKRDSTISFYTDKGNGQNLATCAAIGGTPKMTGLIVWLPSDAVEKFRTQSAQPTPAPLATKAH